MNQRGMENEYPAILVIQTLTFSRSHLHLYLTLSITSLIFLCWSPFDHEFLCIKFDANKRALRNSTFDGYAQAQ